MFLKKLIDKIIHLLESSFTFQKKKKKKGELQIFS